MGTLECRWSAVNLLTMLSFKVGNDHIFLPEGTSVNFERFSPFLGTEEVQAERTLPGKIYYSDANYRILSHLGNFYKGNRLLVVDADLYDGGNFRHSGSLIIQKHRSNTNRVQDTVWDFVFSINSASFYQKIQNLRLSELDMGGVRSFPWTTSNPSDGSNGFWQHIHAARTPRAFPYTFYPIYNPGWVNEQDRKSTFGLEGFYGDFMNRLNSSNNFDFGSGTAFRCDNIYSIVPCIYLSFILECIASQAGYTLSGEILSDPGYLKITIPGHRGIDWVSARKKGSTSLVFTNPVQFDLADFVSPSITVESFLINLKNRLGWRFSFDSTSREINVTAQKQTFANPSIDWTRFVDADYAAEFKTGATVYSLINNIDANDTYPKSADISKINLIGSLASADLLPNPDATDENVVYYCFREDSYYINSFYDTTDSYRWEVVSHNVGSFRRDGQTNELTSSISSMPTVLGELRPGGAWGLFPAGDYQGNHIRLRNSYNDLGIRLLFYHGMHTDSNGNLYPYASSHSSNYAGQHDLTPWSLNYKREFGSVNNGTYDYWFKDWLNIFQEDDVREFTMNLPIHLLLNLKWEDVIRIKGVEFLPIKINQPFPYRGKVAITFKKIIR